MAEREQRGAGAWVLGDASTVRAFALAGCRGRVVAADGAAQALAEARAAGASLVIATQDLAEALDGATAPGDDPRPLLALVPSAVASREGAHPGERVARAVRRALGMPAVRRTEASRHGA